MDLARKRRVAVAAYLSYVAFFYLILFLKLEPFISYTSTLGLIGDVIALLMFWIGIRIHPEDRRKPWVFFSFSAVLYSIGEVLWAYYSEFLGVDPSSPSVCDIFYVSDMFTTLYAGYCLVRQSDIRPGEIVLDTLISVFAVSGLLYNFIWVPMLANGSIEMAGLQVILIQATADLLIFVAFLLLVFGTDVRQLASVRVILMAVSFLGFFGIDQLTMAMDIYELEAPEIFEPFWSFPIWLLGLTSMYPEEDVASIPVHPRLETAFSYFRILLPYIFTFAILFLVGLKFNLLSSLFLWAILLVAVLSLRQIIVLLRNERLVKRVQENERELNLRNIELQRLNRQILHDAEVDFLTQLANRRYIDQSFERLTPRTGTEESLGLILIDVDYFKRINDAFGHQVGDSMLKQVAGCIRSVIRANDIAGRFGGDEFIVLLPGADARTTAAVAGRLEKKVRDDEVLAGRGVTLSIGGTSHVITSEDYDSELMLKQADDALYRAKEAGRNRIVMYGEKE